MAYVGITGTLLQEVRSKIRRLRDSEIEATITKDPIEDMTMTGNEQWFIKRLWGDNLHFKDIMPKEWLSTNKRIELTFLVSDDTEVKHRFCKSFSFNNALILPPPYRREYSDSRADIKLHFNMDDTDLPTEIVEKIKTMVQHREITERWDKVRSQVLTFIEKCKSLNEAVKLWPDVRVYVPREYADKLERKAEKKEAKLSDAAEALKSINVDEVQAAAVIARLSGVQL